MRPITKRDITYARRVAERYTVGCHMHLGDDIRAAAFLGLVVASQTFKANTAAAWTTWAYLKIRDQIGQELRNWREPEGGWLSLDESVPAPEVDGVEARDTLESLSKNLTTLEAEIVKKHMYGKSFHKIGKEHGFSGQYAYQIYGAAFAKMKMGAWSLKEVFCDTDTNGKA